MNSVIGQVLSDNRSKSVTPCEELTNKIKGALYDIANSFVYIGFLLAECNDYKTYLDWGYNSIYDYAFAEFGFKKSSVNNFINVCKVFSSNFSSCGEPLPYSMILKDSYQDFKYSQLVEMLSMSDKQRLQVSSDMTVKEIREIKKNSFEIDFEKIYDMQLNLQEFCETYNKKISGKKFEFEIKGYKVDVSDLWPDGYMVSFDVSFGTSGSGCGHEVFRSFDEFKKECIYYLSRYDEDIKVLDPELLSRRLEKRVDIDEDDLKDLFDLIEDQYLEVEDISFADFCLSYFKEHNYSLVRDFYVWK